MRWWNRFWRYSLPSSEDVQTIIELECISQDRENENEYVRVRIHLPSKRVSSYLYRDSRLIKYVQNFPPSAQDEIIAYFARENKEFRSLLKTRNNYFNLNDFNLKTFLLSFSVILAISYIIYWIL